MSQTGFQFDASEVAEVLRAIASCRIAVIGDVMLDAYVYGPLERISPEAPVPVFEIQREENKLGGAANVAACVSALGSAVRLCGVVGEDSHGACLVAEASRMYIDTGAVLCDPGRPTTTKTRIVARNQQVIRLDREVQTPLEGKVEQQLLDCVRQAVDWADAIILSDYAKGVLTRAVCDAALRYAAGKPVVVDPKTLPWERYRGATVIKPNRTEAELFVNRAIENERSAEHAARQISSTLAAEHVLITRGAAGMTLMANRRNGESAGVYHLPAARRELIDVTGAGDVVAATLTTALAAGTDAVRAAWLANVAAGIKVGKFGAASIRPDELLAEIGGAVPSFSQKVMNRSQAVSLTHALRQRGKRVVFTNGCFDLLHLGHVTYLERSRRLGDFLVVGLNSDASVRRLKGPKRPVQNETDRAQIIASQASVDAVVVFDEDTPFELIQELRPEILTKGADYGNKEAVVGWQLVESRGGRVVLIELVDGRSTTHLVHRAA